MTLEEVKEKLTELLPWVHNERYICPEESYKKFIEYHEALVMALQELDRIATKENRKMKEHWVYRCDPDKNVECEKGIGCCMQGGPCYCTLDKEYAMLNAQGNLIVEDWFCTPENEENPHGAQEEIPLHDAGNFNEERAMS